MKHPNVIEHEAYLQNIERIAAPRKSRPYKEDRNDDIGTRLRTTAIMSVAAVVLLVLAGAPFSA
ncbi:hypothetical protein AB2B41_04620 [Marimonas sp. MJW-29]|uniref:Uncharacterized protein n=1 Tax=Sulfitobacter sediminis TaxID=3234186 RepID=A0ABV3RJK2_9RHOB